MSLQIVGRHMRPAARPPHAAARRVVHSVRSQGEGELTVSRRALRSVLAVGVLVAAVMSLIAVAIPAGAGAHAERATFFPDPNVGDFPQYRTTGPSWVVCKPDTRQRIQNMSADVRRYNEELLARCNFKSIQRAVNRARNGDRILVLPG